MENRRPPRPKPAGREFDKNRGRSPYRPTGAGGGDSRSSGSQHREATGHQKVRGPRRGPGEGRDYGQTRVGGRGPRRDGGLSRMSDSRFDDRKRFGQKGRLDRGGSRSDKRNRPEPEIKVVSDSQITDGKFRGKSLLNSDSPFARPTQRKIREAAFRILARRVKAGRILDLGAAAGTIGIEAISRGAMLVTFVDRSARMCSYIRKNLAAFEIKDGHGEVVEMEALPFLIRNAKRRRTWDIVYLDIPVGDEHTSLVDFLGRGKSVTESGLLIIQHPSSASLPEKIGRLNRWRSIDKDGTMLTIYERI